MKRRKKRRGTLLVALLAVGALALTAGMLWRWVLQPAATPETLRPSPVLSTPPSGGAATGGEEFSAAERRRLEDILRQKKPEAQR